MEKRYKHLTLEKRHLIQLMLRERASMRAIARMLEVAVSTISREIKRNKCAETDEYSSCNAEKLRLERKPAPCSKIERSRDLQTLIEDMLAMEMSPDAIANRLKQEGSCHAISHESIYKWIYGVAYERALYRYLYRRKRRRGRRPCLKAPRERIPDRVSVHERPATIREEFGHWEADTLHFAGRSGAVLTLYERKSKLLLGAKLHSRSSTETIDNLVTILEKLPENALKSITFDNGLEFYNYRLLKEKFGIATYFCDPYSPWQKGGVENANGLLRGRYIPKHFTENDVTATQVQTFMARINHTPRKSLHYLSPMESFLLFSSCSVKLFNFNSACVALRV